MKKTLIGLALGMCAVAGQAATITIQNNDGAGEGFNDNTAATPANGNNGTTLGQQRLNVFQRAADIWGAILVSDVEIVVSAQFNPLNCDAMGAVLGSAGATTVHQNFANAPFPNTQYSAALADSLAGVDLNGGTPEINTQFNVNVDPGANQCPTTAGGWNYALDGTAVPGAIALLPVVLHELGHGLGFQTFTNTANGNFIGGTPDIWTRFLFDLDQNDFWINLTAPQRVASAINDPNLVWNGPIVDAEFPNVLGNPNALVINTPAGIAGTYVAMGAAFGPPVPQAGLTGDIVLGNDGTGPDVNDGCEALTNGGAINGNIAIVNRGNCNFTVKTVNAQNAGAIGVIIANNVPDGLPPLGGADPTITIPTIGISQADGTTIIGALPANGTFTFDFTEFAGTNGGHVRMNAPNPLQPGSSVSHWTPDTTPNLLMEPAITPSIFEEVDLTLQLFQEIGWNTTQQVDPDIVFSDGFEN